MSDQELIELIKEDQDYLGIVYKNCKEYCIGFMRRISTRIDDDDLNDIFQNAMIILYEKIIAGNFQLTASIQTYLNSVCRFQLLNKFRSDKKTVHTDIEPIIDKHMSFDISIEDVLEPIENEKESQFKALESALNALKDAGGICYELLTLFWYHKKSMEDLSIHFGYTNAKNAKTQKYKCQKRLEKLAINYLNN